MSDMHASTSSPIDALHDRIRACRLCEIGGFPISPPPLAWGTAPTPFMLIGQAPGLTDLRGGRMYLGPAARKLIGWLKDAGFSDDDIGTTIYMTAITKCFPGRLPGKSTDRAPSARERANCRPWLDSQLALVRPKAIILFGKMAIDLWLPRRSLLETVGTVFWAEDGMAVTPGFPAENANLPAGARRVLVPLPHSSGASIWLNDASNQALVRTAIANLSSIREAILSAELGAGTRDESARSVFARPLP